MADSGYAEGDRAYNGQTGETAIFTGGKWVIQGSPQMPLPQGDAEALKALQEQATDASYLAQKARKFKAMQAGENGQSPVQTGPMFGELGIPHLAENINPLPALANTIDPRINQLKSLSNQAWVHMRPQGSGAIRGYEAEDFKNAFPNIGEWGRTNNGNADRMQLDAMTAANKLKFVDDFIRGGNGTFADANAAWEAQQRGAVPVGPNGRIMPPPGPDPIGNTYLGGDPRQASSYSPPQQSQVPAAQILNWTPDKGLH